MTDRRLLTDDDMRELLRVSRDWWAREANREKLYAAGCPRPLPGFGSRRWDPAAYEAWLDRLGGLGPAEVEIDTDRQIDEILAARAREIAGSARRKAS